MDPFTYLSVLTSIVLALGIARMDAVDTLLKGWDHFQAQGLIYPITIGLLFLLSILAARTRKTWFHAFYAVFFLVYILAFILAPSDSPSPGRRFMLLTGNSP